MNQIIDKGDQNNSVQKKHLREEKVVYKNQQQTKKTEMMEQTKKKLKSDFPSGSREQTVPCLSKRALKGKKTIFLVAEFERRNEYFRSKREVSLDSQLSGRMGNY